MVTRTNKIFVGGLSASTSSEDLKKFFDKYGKVCGICTDSCVQVPCRVFASYVGDRRNAYV